MTLRKCKKKIQKGITNENKSIGLIIELEHTVLKRGEEATMPFRYII